MKPDRISRKITCSLIHVHALTDVIRFAVQVNLLINMNNASDVAVSFSTANENNNPNPNLK